MLSRRVDLSALDREHQTLLQDYEKVQQRLQEMHHGQEGSRLHAEAELRSKESAVRVLQSNVGKYLVTIHCVMQYLMMMLVCL